MSLDVDLLVGYQLAEYKAATRMRVALLSCQFVVAITVAFSVFFDSNKASYYIAIVALIFLFCYLSFDLRYRAHRQAAERARRTTLIWGGLGEEPDATELLDLKMSFKVKEEDARLLIKKDYFASKSAPGTMRLVEMLEESAFWTSELQAWSARTMGGLALGATLFGVAFLALILPMVEPNTSVTTARVILGFVGFALSSDVWGAVVGHVGFAKEAARIRTCLAQLKLKGCPQSELMLALNDYNAAAESGPLNLPYAYDANEKRLNEAWKEHTSSKATTKPGTP